jgi:four helix bundle protein
MKNYKLLKVWSNGMEIAKNAYSLVRDFPREEKFGLSSQITRAAISISSNIAEGSSRTSDKHNIQFLEIALGSCFELETQVLLAELLGFGSPELREKIIYQIVLEEKMLHSLINKLKTKLIDRPNLKANS